MIRRSLVKFLWLQEHGWQHWCLYPVLALPTDSSASRTVVALLHLHTSFLLLALSCPAAKTIFFLLQQVNDQAHQCCSVQLRVSVTGHSSMQFSDGIYIYIFNPHSKASMQETHCTAFISQSDAIYRNTTSVKTVVKYHKSKNDVFSSDNSGLDTIGREMYVEINRRHPSFIFL